LQQNFVPNERKTYEPVRNNRQKNSVQNNILDADHPVGVSRGALAFSAGWWRFKP
jgi:hypothetical protein